MKISTVIIAQNEAAHIIKCVKSALPFSDEVLVIDSYSKDDTVKYAKSAGAKVLSRTFDNYCNQKNFGIAKALHANIFSLDADEVVDETLKDAILNLKSSPANLKKKAYLIYRKNFIGKRWIRFGGLYPDGQMRLFDKSARWQPPIPHEKLILQQGTLVQLLQGHILHYSFKNMGDYWQRSLTYADLWAKNHSINSFKAVALMLIKPLTKWIEKAIIKGAIWHGKIGWQFARYNFLATYYKYRWSLKKSKDI